MRAGDRMNDGLVSFGLALMIIFGVPTFAILTGMTICGEHNNQLCGGTHPEITIFIIGVFILSFFITFAGLIMDSNENKPRFGEIR